MSEHDNHKLNRSLARATFEAVEARERHIAAIAPMAPGDMSQQVQVTISGKVGAHVIYQEIDVYWPNPFTMRTDSTSGTDSTLSNPHFNSGVEILTDGHVSIDPQVRDWIADDSDRVIGAKVRISVFAPNALKKRPYNANVHLTFFGYGAPQVDDDDLM